MPVAVSFHLKQWFFTNSCSHFVYLTISYFFGFFNTLLKPVSAQSCMCIVHFIAANYCKCQCSCIYPKMVFIMKMKSTRFQVLTRLIFKDIKVSIFSESHLAAHNSKPLKPLNPKQAQIILHN